MASFWASRKKLAAAAAKYSKPGAPGVTPLGPDAVDSGKGRDFPPAPPGAQPTLQGGGGYHPPLPTEKLVPHHAKGAPSNGGTTVLGNPPVQRQRWGEQSQSSHHPRLCENHERSLIGGPRKMGVQGGDSMENEAERPKFDLWLPPVPLWLLSGHPERSSPPGRRNPPSPARKRQLLPRRNLRPTMPKARP